MVNIVRPGELGQQGRSEISTGIAATAGSGVVSLGREALSVGRQSQASNQLSLARQMSALVDVEGKRIFNESKQAHQSATLLNKMTEATESFIKGKTERYSRTTDENGNPTFTTLHKDIEQLGKDTLDQTARTIIDPEVARQFKANFGNYVANQKITALKTARNQQVSFGRSSLDTGLGKLVTQAAADDIDQLGTYEQQGLESLQSAMTSGVISQEEFSERSKEFSAIIREGAIHNAIKNDKESAAGMLQMSAQELGIEESTKTKLVKELDASLKSDQIQVQKAKERADLDNMTQEAAIVEDMENRIEADALRENELIAMEDKISAPKFSELKKKFVKETEKRNKELKTHKELGAKIVNGEDISDVKPSQIDKFFDYMVDQRRDLIDAPTTITEEAQLAATIPAPVKRFAKRLEHSAKYGSTENASEVLNAYTYIKDRKKPTLESSFDREATMIMEHAELLVERGGVVPAEAMTQARDIIFKTDADTRNIREDLFKKEKEFKVNNIEETAATELDAEGFLGDNKISQDAVNTFRSFTREGFIRSGNRDTAVAYAKQMMSKTHGISSVTATEQYMFAPPEKMLPSFSADSLRRILVKEVTPALPAGVAPESISLASDDITVGTIQISGTREGERVEQTIPSWVITYKMKVGDEEIEVPLINEKTGQPKRWTPLGTTVFEEEQKAKITEAEQARQEFVEEQE